MLESEEIFDEEDEYNLFLGRRVSEIECELWAFHTNSVVIGRDRKLAGLYSQDRIIEMCSAFCLIGKTRDACVAFVKQVFAEPFAKTEDGTILKKIKGPNKMLEIIDTYWDVQGFRVKN